MYPFYSKIPVLLVPLYINLKFLFNSEYSNQSQFMWFSIVSKFLINVSGNFKLVGPSGFFKYQF